MKEEVSFGSFIPITMVVIVVIIIGVVIWLLRKNKKNSK